LQNADAFYDVKDGMNDADTGIGFQATEGWDPASGTSISQMCWWGL
jgi:hypothetical protein